MTESQWNKLKPGDYIRSKREPSTVMKVTEALPDMPLEAVVGAWMTRISYLRASEFERYEPAEGEKV